jgi:hypothetical protein
MEVRALRPDHVVGRERPAGGEIGGVGARERPERRVAHAVFEHPAAPRTIAVARRLRERGAQDRREPGGGVHCGREIDADRHAHASGVLPACGDEALGTIDARDHALVCGARVVGEGEEPVVQEDESLDRRAALEHLGRELRERESRHHVRDDRPRRAERLARERLVLRRRLIRHDERDVGVRVVDELVRQERVQERLDRRIRRAGIEEMRAELVHHLLVGERAERAQPAEMREVDGGQPGRLDRVEIPSAALHEERLDLVADERLHRPLERRVAAAVHHEVGIAADQPRRVDAQGHVLAPPGRETVHELGGVAIGPATMHRRRLGGRPPGIQPHDIAADSRLDARRSAPRRQRVVIVG